MSSLFKSLNGFPTGHTPVPIFETSNSGSNTAPPDDDDTTATTNSDVESLQLFLAYGSSNISYIGTNKCANAESDKFNYFKADLAKRHATNKYTLFKRFGGLIRRVVKQNGAVTTDLHKLAHTRQSSPFGQAALLPAIAAKLSQNSLIVASSSTQILEEEDWVCVDKPRFKKTLAPI